MADVSITQRENFKFIVTNYSENNIEKVFISFLLRIGRKSTLVIAIVWMTISGIVTALVAGLATLNSTRFFNAMMTTGVFQTAFVLGL